MDQEGTKGAPGSSQMGRFPVKVPAYYDQVIDVFSVFGLNKNICMFTSIRFT